MLIVSTHYSGLAVSALAVAHLGAEHLEFLATSEHVVRQPGDVVARRAAAAVAGA